MHVLNECFLLICMITSSIIDPLFFVTGFHQFGNIVSIRSFHFTDSAKEDVCPTLTWKIFPFIHKFVSFYSFEIFFNHYLLLLFEKSSTFIKSDGEVGKPRTRFSTLFRLSSSEWIRRKLLADSKHPPSQHKKKRRKIV